MPTTQKPVKRHVCFQTRVLKNDFARYNVDEEDDVIEDDDNGWKIIHTDVFRFPPFKSLFCAILGQLQARFLACVACLCRIV